MPNIIFTLVKFQFTELLTNDTIQNTFSLTIRWEEAAKLTVT